MYFKGIFNKINQLKEEAKRKEQEENASFNAAYERVQAERRKRKIVGIAVIGESLLGLSDDGLIFYYDYNTAMWNPHVSTLLDKNLPSKENY